jgi:hypothetical protein
VNQSDHRRHASPLFVNQIVYQLMDAADFKVIRSMGLARPSRPGEIYLPARRVRYG